MGFFRILSDFLGFSWDFLGFNGILWDSLGFSRILLGFSRFQWDFLGFFGILWDSLGFFGILLGFSRILLGFLKWNRPGSMAGLGGRPSGGILEHLRIHWPGIGRALILSSGRYL